MPAIEKLNGSGALPVTFTAVFASVAGIVFN